MSLQHCIPLAKALRAPKDSDTKFWQSDKGAIRFGDDPGTRHKADPTASETHKPLPKVAHEEHLHHLIRHASHAPASFASVAHKMGVRPRQVAGMVADLHSKNPDAVEIHQDGDGRVQKFRISREKAARTASDPKDYQIRLKKALTKLPRTFSAYVSSRAQEEGDKLLIGDGTIRQYGVVNAATMWPSLSANDLHVTYAVPVAEKQHGLLLLKGLHEAGIACPYAAYPMATATVWGHRHDATVEWDRDPHGTYDYVATPKGRRLLVGRFMQVVLDFRPVSLENAKALVSFLEEHAQDREDNADVLPGSGSALDVRTSTLEKIGNLASAWANVLPVGGQQIIVLSADHLEGDEFKSSEIQTTPELHVFFKSVPQGEVDNQLSKGE